MLDAHRVRRFLDLHPRLGGLALLGLALAFASVNLAALALVGRWMPAGFPFAGAIGGAALLYVGSGRGWSEMNASVRWNLAQIGCGAVGVLVGFGANLITTGGWL